MSTINASVCIGSVPTVVGATELATELAKELAKELVKELYVLLLLDSEDMPECGRQTG